MADDGSGRVAAAAAGGPDAGGDNHGNLASTSSSRTAAAAAAVSSGPDEPGPGPGQGLQQAPSRAVSFRNLNHHRRQSQSERISEILEVRHPGVACCSSCLAISLFPPLGGRGGSITLVDTRADP